MAKSKVNRRLAPKQRKRLTDVHERTECDISTVSVIPPRVTDRCVLHGQDTSLITASATGAVTTTFYFTAGASDVSLAGFDQYRIAAVRFNLIPQQNAIGLTTNASTTVQPVFCVIDYDDDVALGSFGAAEAYSTCVMVPPGKSCSRTFCPHVAIAAYNGAFTGYANETALWIDCTSSNILHYGIKLYILAATALQSQLQLWNATVEYYIELRRSN